MVCLICLIFFITGLIIICFTISLPFDGHIYKGYILEADDGQFYTKASVGVGDDISLM